MTKNVDFYFDYGSPATYLAWTQIDKIINHCATLEKVIVLYTVVSKKIEKYLIKKCEQNNIAIQSFRNL